jgi:hypothetical protein
MGIHLNYHLSAFSTILSSNYSILIEKTAFVGKNLWKFVVAFNPQIEHHEKITIIHYD